MKKLIYCVVTLVFGAATFFVGAYIQAKQYEKIFVEPYLTEITRSLIQTATLQREGITNPVYPENYGLGYLTIAEGLGMNDERTLELVKSYSEKYQIELSPELTALLEPYDSFEINEKMVEAMKQSLLVGQERNYSKEMNSIQSR